jgi:mannitol/fructose-specific phosphotransferase system IIA component
MIYAGYSKSERTARAAEVLEQVNLGIEWTTSQISYLVNAIARHSEQTLLFSQMNLQET